MNYDQDAFHASLELVRRAGASQFELGYLHDDVPIEEAGWWASANYQGARIFVEDNKGPVEAVEALARRLLIGAQCRRCGEPVSLQDDREGCRWTRNGRTWIPGCGKPVDFSIPRMR